MFTISGYMTLILILNFNLYWQLTTNDRLFECHLINARKFNLNSSFQLILLIDCTLGWILTWKYNVMLYLEYYAWKELINKFGNEYFYGSMNAEIISSLPVAMEMVTSSINYARKPHATITRFNVTQILCNIT